MEPFLVPQPNDSTVCAEDSHAMPHCMSQVFVNNRVILHCHGQTIPDHFIYRHIKECWGRKAPFCGYTGCSELGSMVPILFGEHLLPRPELCQNAPHFFPTPYPSKVFNSRTRSKLSYAFMRSMNTKNGGS